MVERRNQHQLVGSRIQTKSDQLTLDPFHCNKLGPVSRVSLIQNDRSPVNQILRLDKREPMA
ncbi:hypothetical protein E2320_013851 [Naja naja]|nr:hypothetical protein E2320_013851 [Naja naja]